MIAFGYRFLFLDEDSLIEKKEDIAKKNISVLENKDIVLSKRFTLRSPWVVMTLRNVRYYSNTRFENMPHNDAWALEIEDVITLIWDGNDKISYIKGVKYSPKLLEFWIAHTFFPLVLEIQRKYKILHVGGVELEKKAVLFSAFSFGGKSTLTEFFLKKGHALLGDDTVAIDKNNGNYSAIASYPYYRPYREPEILGEPISNFVSKVLPLKSIYALKKSAKDESVIISSRLKGIDKFKALHDSSFINFNFLKVEHMHFFTAMAKEIPIYTVTVPWDLDRLEEVYQAIIMHNNV